MWTVSYIASIALTNWAFGYIGVQPIPGTDQVWHPLSLIVGFWFVLRDLTHREIGARWVLAPIIAGVGISFILAEPQIAFASAVAFMVSELSDTAVYSYTRRPFRDRILISSAVSVPVDSVLFLWLAFGTPAISATGVSIMVASKMAGAFAVWSLMRRRVA